MKLEQSISHGLIKRFGPKFHLGSQVWQETPEEGRRMHRPKCCEYNNKDRDNSLDTLKDKNYQASSQKFRKIAVFIMFLNLS